MGRAKGIRSKTLLSQKSKQINGKNLSTKSKKKKKSTLKREKRKRKINIENKTQTCLISYADSERNLTVFKDAEKANWKVSILNKVGTPETYLLLALLKFITFHNFNLSFLANHLSFILPHSDL